MLARYPKVEPAHIIKGSAEPTTKSENSSSSVVCPILPRLCIDDTSNVDELNDRSKTTTATLLDWSSDRGCDSAPVVGNDRNSDDRFFFVLGDHVHRHHHQHYPRCVRQQVVELNDDSVKEKSSSRQIVESLRHFIDEDDESSIRTEASDGEDGVVSKSGVFVTMDVSPEEDFKRLHRCVHLLQCSGYYYEGLSWQQATLKLRKCLTGTFLIRDSENANYLFTMSVQTNKGPTSVRIAYKGGRFRLDSDEDLVTRMPVFDTVTDLVEHYVKVSRESRARKSVVSCCWLDLAGECSAPVELYTPLYKQVHSLKHLSRLNVVKQLRTDHVPLEWTLEHSRSLCLPMALKEYIKEYPHGH